MAPKKGKKLKPSIASEPSPLSGKSSPPAFAPDSADAKESLKAAPKLKGRPKLPKPQGDRTDSKHEKKLTVWPATAICGNDITSSCLYVSALAILAAGALAPISLLIVAFILYLFRSVYAEAVGALPMNGGAYNTLLNTTSKSRATIAAALTLLSYMATAVISAIEANHYVVHLAHGLEPYVIPMTIGLLLVFACLTIMGITESAVVALGIFILHMVTLTALAIAVIIYLLSSAGLGQFVDNWNTPVPKGGFATAEKARGEDAGEHVEVHSVAEAMDGGRKAAEEAPGAQGASRAEKAPAPEKAPDAAQAPQAGPEKASRSKEAPAQAPAQAPAEEAAEARSGHTSLLAALFFGFAAAMLGISGFESSANFVEEQAPGVFPKTLRNMWLAVSFFNPLMAVLVLAAISIEDVAVHKEYVLAHLGGVAGGKAWGPWLSTLVSVDAALVLSGAVLTSFIGVNGLAYRMTLDRCLPQILLKKNKRGAPYIITICFFLAGVSVLFITKGDLQLLAGVYTISFLLVMVLFALGNMLLKIKRSRLPRPARASWPGVMVAMTAVLAGVVGNVIEKDPAKDALLNDKFEIFLWYFIPTMALIALMLTRIQLLQGVLFALRALMASIRGVVNVAEERVKREIDVVTSQTIVFFTRGDNKANLNKAILYVRANEHTRHIKVVNVVANSDQEPPTLRSDLKMLDEVYPDMSIELEVVEGAFGPALLDDLSRRWNVPLNFMFVGTPGQGFPHGIADLGGVRVII